MRAVFITATGTEVGKTHVACGLIRGWRLRDFTVGALKPVVSGVDPKDPAGSDPALLLEALGEEVSEETLDAIAPWRFEAALSPDMAAARAGETIDYDELLNICRAELDMDNERFVIEGAGGVMVPINDTHLFRDLMADLELPALVVAGSYLGTISHTLSTLAALRAANIPIAGVIVSESEDSPVPLEETVETMLRFEPDMPFFALPRQAMSDMDAAALSYFVEGTIP